MTRLPGFLPLAVILTFLWAMHALLSTTAPELHTADTERPKPQRQLFSLRDDKTHNSKSDVHQNFKSKQLLQKAPKIIRKAHKVKKSELKSSGEVVDKETVIDASVRKNVSKLIKNDVLLEIRATIRKFILEDRPVTFESVTSALSPAPREASFIRYRYDRDPQLKHLVHFEIRRQLKSNMKKNITERQLLGSHNFAVTSSNMKSKNESHNSMGAEEDFRKQEIYEPTECKIFPDDLKGSLPGLYDPDLLTLTAADVTSRHGDLDPGGTWTPRDCTPTQRVAVIFPYRARERQLHVTLSHVIALLQRQRSAFQIFVVEEEWPTIFNRGLVLNAGFLEAVESGKHGNFDCVIFHDVDLISLDDRCLYRCADAPLHIRSVESKFNFQLTWPLFFGGITSFTPEQFKKVNGFSNLYFGWGSEDDDLRSRCIAAGLGWFRYSPSLCFFDMLHHARDEGNGRNEDRELLFRHATERMREDGLTSLRPHVTSVTSSRPYTWMRLRVNMTEILEEAGARVQPLLQHLRGVAESGAWRHEGLYQN